LLLIGVFFVVSVICWFLAIAIAVTPVPGSAAGWGLFGLLRLVVGLIFLVISIIGCVKAYQGEMWKLPIIGDIAEKNA
jgi:uncharacterized membrane protein